MNTQKKNTIITPWADGSRFQKTDFTYFYYICKSLIICGRKSIGINLDLTMKKLLSFCVLAGLVMACTGNSEIKEPSGDPPKGSDDPVQTDPSNDEPGTDGSEDAIDWSDPDWYSVNFWERTDRQKAGLRGPVKKWHETQYTTYTEYEYDEAGHLLKMSFVDTQSDEQPEYWEYTYDAQGRLVQKEYFWYDGSSPYCMETIEYEYGNGDRLVATNQFTFGPSSAGVNDVIVKGLSRSHDTNHQPTGEDHRIVTYTFGEDGNLEVTEESYYQEVGIEEKQRPNQYSYIIGYQADGYPHTLDSDLLRFTIREITYYDNGMYKDFKYGEQNSYNFDTGVDEHYYRMKDDPRYLTVEAFDLLDGDPSFISLTPRWRRVKFNEHGDPILLQDSYDKAPWSEGATPTYEDSWEDYVYDKYGNWVEYTAHFIGRYDGNAGTTHYAREITYF